jgi:hypothetical protein
MNPAENLLLCAPVGHAEGETVKPLAETERCVRQFRERFRALRFKKRASVLPVRKFI